LFGCDLGAGCLIDSVIRLTGCTVPNDCPKVINQGWRRRAPGERRRGRTRRMCRYWGGPMPVQFPGMGAGRKPLSCVFADSPARHATSAIPTWSGRVLTEVFSRQNCLLMPAKQGRPAIRCLLSLLPRICSVVTIPWQVPNTPPGTLIFDKDRVRGQNCEVLGCPVDLVILFHPSNSGM